MLDLVFTSAQEIVRDIKIRSSLGCSEHILIEFVISRSVGLAKCGVRTLSFRRANYSRNCWTRSSGKLLLKAKETSKGDYSLRMPFWKRKSSLSSSTGKLADETGNWHGVVRTCWAN